ncbi:hypothetical protein DASB73_029750 [Starmerella bacillaris]|uniref:J domain-containing protein n=1 Tax=Starmerella bacillaris TaxID=1247836 RepID=A0AAV5RLY6_STABA|nr:hypothetical protein DASB73_029750 [Starmerella bacillaris]
MSTHYAVLGIERSSSYSEIKKAFHKIALRHHPDRNPNGDVELFKRAVEAHEVLGDEKKRKEYDKQLLGKESYTSNSFFSGATYGNQHSHSGRRSRFNPYEDFSDIPEFHSQNNFKDTFFSPFNSFEAFDSFPTFRSTKADSFHFEKSQPSDNLRECFESIFSSPGLGNFSFRRPHSSRFQEEEEKRKKGKKDKEKYKPKHQNIYTQFSSPDFDMQESMRSTADIFKQYESLKRNNKESSKSKFRKHNTDGPVDDTYPIFTFVHDDAGDETLKAKEKDRKREREKKATHDRFMKFADLRSSQRKEILRKLKEAEVEKELEMQRRAAKEKDEQIREANEKIRELEKKERERLEQEKLEQEVKEREMRERERIERERIEQERIEQERIEQQKKEQQDREEEERIRFQSGYVFESGHTHNTSTHISGKGNSQQQYETSEQTDNSRHASDYHEGTNSEPIIIIENDKTSMESAASSEFRPDSNSSTTENSNGSTQNQSNFLNLADQKFMDTVDLTMDSDSSKEDIETAHSTSTHYKRTNDAPGSPSKKHKPFSMKDLFSVPPFTQKTGQSFNLNTLNNALKNEKKRVRQYNRPFSSSVQQTQTPQNNATQEFVPQLQLKDPSILTEYTSESSNLFAGIQELQIQRNNLINMQNNGQNVDPEIWARNLDTTYQLLRDLLAGTEKCTNVAFGLE